MIESRFDPSQAVRFHLERGVVERSGSLRELLVPADALLELCRGAGSDALTDFGRRLGTDVGRRVAEQLGNELAQASPEAVVDHLGGELALLGLGALQLERWGRALVLTFTEPPAGREGSSLVAAAVEGALQRATSRDVRALVLGRDDDRLRLILVSPEAAGRVEQWLEAGTGFGEVVARLNGAAGGAR
jgi:hypothetical protein